MKSSLLIWMVFLVVLLCTNGVYNKPTDFETMEVNEMNKVYAAVGATCPQSAECVSYTKQKVIYHQTMTPSWLEAHASYIDSSHLKTKEQLTFSANSVENSALLKVPMIPAGVLHYSAPLTVKIIVSHDVSIGTNEDSDIVYGVSDGMRFVGFVMYNKGSNVPCYVIEGSSGTSFTDPKYSSNSQTTSESFYSGQFVFTFKLDERWGSCYTAHDGGFVKTASYNNRLMLNRGLTLEVYKENKGEKLGIKFIVVSVIEDA